MRRNGLTFILWMIPSLAYAVGFLTYDTAQTLQPQQMELSGGFAAGDAHWVGQIGGRLGLRPDLDIPLKSWPAHHGQKRWPRGSRGRTMEISSVVEDRSDGGGGVRYAWFVHLQRPRARIRFRSKGTCISPFLIQ